MQGQQENVAKCLSPWVTAQAVPETQAPCRKPLPHAPAHRPLPCSASHWALPTTGASLWRRCSLGTGFRARSRKVPCGCLQKASCSQCPPVAQGGSAPGQVEPRSP